MILQRYIVRQCLAITALVAVILLSISMISQLNVYLLAVVSGNLKVELLAPILISFMPQYMSIVLPLSFFIATVITLNQLHKNSELIIMSTCGINRSMLGKMFAPLVLVLFVLGLLLSLFITPYSSRKAQEILTYQEGLDSLDIVTPKTFIALNDHLDFYTESLSEDKKTLNSVYIFIRPETPNEASQIIYSKQAKVDHQDGVRHIKMSEGYQMQIVPGQADVIRTTFASTLIRLPARNQVVSVSRKETLDNADVLASDDPEIYQVFYWRVSVAFFIPILFLIALCLFSSQARQDSSAKNFLMLFISCLAYIGSNVTISSLASDGVIRPEIGYGATHLVAILGALFYYRYSFGFKK